jgi:hypothetical protein
MTINFMVKKINNNNEYKITAYKITAYKQYSSFIVESEISGNSIQLTKEEAVIDIQDKINEIKNEDSWFCFKLKKLSRPDYSYGLEDKFYIEFQLSMNGLNGELLNAYEIINNLDSISINDPILEKEVEEKLKEEIKKQIQEIKNED